MYAAKYKCHTRKLRYTIQILACVKILTYKNVSLRKREISFWTYHNGPTLWYILCKIFLNSHKCIDQLYESWHVCSWSNSCLPDGKMGPISSFWQQWDFSVSWNNTLVKRSYIITLFAFTSIILVSCSLLLIYIFYQRKIRRYIGFNNIYHNNEKTREFRIWDKRKLMCLFLGISIKLLLFLKPGEALLAIHHDKCNALYARASPST